MGVERQVHMLVQCCVCKRVRKGGAWVKMRPPPDREGGVSHGYCPACAAKAFEQVRHMKRGIDGGPGPQTLSGATAANM